jgi:hypothetical protein
MYDRDTTQHLFGQSHKGLSAKFVSIEFSEVRQELSKDNSFEGCVDLRERDIISVGKANSLGEAGKETILWHGT